MKYINTDLEFSNLLNSNKGLLVVDFFATWCGPCQNIAPSFENLSKQYFDVVFAKVDTDKCPVAAVSQNIAALPTFIFYVDKTKVDSVRGASLSELENKIRHWSKSAEVTKSRHPGYSLNDTSNKDFQMWFSGPVNGAITKSKAEKLLLIVFVYDNDSSSSQLMLERWESDVIKSICKQYKCVALKFLNTSVDAKQFNEFYPFTCVPVSFLIDDKGKSLEVISDALNVEQLKERLLTAIHIVSNLKIPVFDESKPCCSSISTDDANKKARELLNKLHKEKEDRKLEDEKHMEIKRREEGKSMAEAREKQKELEMLAIAEENKRSKKADKEYLQKLRAQIEADKKEKAAKYNAEKNVQSENLQKKQTERTEISMKNAALLAQQNEELNKTAKIQFRLSDGRQLKESFSSDLPFEEAKKFLSTFLPSNKRFHFIKMHPRQEITDQDYNKTFKELDLVPSSVIIVMLEGNGKSNFTLIAQQGHWITSIMFMLTRPVVGVYRWIYGLLFPGTSTTAIVRGNSRQVGHTQTGFGEQQGNIRRMPNPGSSSKQVENSDDDNATWNGNSTQQL